MQGSEESAGRWLLLIHQLPPKPDYLRVKVRRRLQGLGAVALKSTVYVLPNRAETVEDFEWLRAEIEADGGEATVVAASLLAGVTDGELEALFRTEPDARYAEIARVARVSTASHDVVAAKGDAARLRRRLEDVIKTDFFGADGRAAAEQAVAQLETQIAGDVPRARTGRADVRAMRGRTWVTREGVFVDRIASAWLIRRFIDPEASFKFVPGKSYRPKAGELRFDMYEGEYTHEGDRCTFETLLDRFGLADDPALGAIAEIVHDIDLKDDRFGRAETAGVAVVLGGIARLTSDDAERLQQGAALFDALYAQLRGTGS
jgi:hypothetical protein